MRGDTGTPRIGIIDGPVSLDGIAIAATQDFSGCGGTVQESDALRHGNGVASFISAGCRGIEIYVARVFGESLVCRPEQVAQAIRWLMEREVCLINMSFGLRHDRNILGERCGEAADAGICLVAAAPAQGAGVYPSLYPGVVRATGDARCSPSDISWLATEQADYGGYPGKPGDAFAGASAGCASVSGALARLAGENPDLETPGLLQKLATTALYRGPERRGGRSNPSPAGAA